jgi:histidine phosphotransferase ChpT
VLSAKGINARIPPHAEALLAGAPESGAVDAHGIQAYYAGMVARAAGMKTAFAIEGDTVTITAEMDPENPNSAPIDTGMIG